MKENKAMVNEKFGRLSGDVLLFTLVCLVAALASGNASAATRYRVLGTIEPADRIKIVRSRARFRMIEVRGHTYYRTLHDKLGWSGQIRVNK